MAVLKRVAFISPRCGEDAPGEAAALCLSLAQSLGRDPDVQITILTTCGSDEPEGHVRIREVHVIRFPAVRALRTYVDRYRSHFDAFVFFGFAHATTVDCLPLVEDRAILAPLAHDEAALRPPVWNELFARPAGFVFATVAERELVRARFPARPAEGPVAGVAVRVPSEVSAERFRSEYGIEGPFVLELGGREASANLRPAAPVRVISLGDREMLAERTMWDALAACDATSFLSPDPLTTGLFEGWALEKPAIVSSRATALVELCRRSQGGVWVASDEELAAALRVMDARVRAELGRQGRSFVERNSSWMRVVETYRIAVRALYHSSPYR